MGTEARVMLLGERARPWSGTTGHCKTDSRTKFLMMKKSDETYPDEQLNENNVTNCCCNVKWSAQIGIAVW